MAGPGFAASAKFHTRDLVAVPIDYSENKRVLVDELKARLPVVAEPAS